jgi:Subtilase family
MEVKVLEGDRRGMPRRAAAFARWRLVLLQSLAASVALVATAAPQSASAWWSRVSASPSSTSPYSVCPRVSHHAACALIEDPTRGSRARGPVAAGAITAGPEQEVSPALSGSGVEGGYSPEDLRSAYDLPSKSAGAGQTVAVVDAYDDPDAESDMNAYRTKYEIPECRESGGCFRKVNEVGGRSYPAANTTWAREISVDLDMVSAICPNCHILLVEARNNEAANIANAEDEAATLGATEISDSFAESSPPESAQEAAAYDHPEIPIAVAGGDDGYGVVWPAANPHVIAVGGTELRPASGGDGWTESVWSGTGSGCSREPKPTWQTDSGCAGRTTNDVAAVAGPNTPVSVYNSYETGSNPWMLGSGTSVATPIIAAAMALASPYTRSFEGADALYLELANGVDGFSDIISGSNGSCHSYLCEAEPGYDGPSGLGSLRGAPQVPPPSPATVHASSVGYTEATLEATVNPHGVALSRCAFEYGLTTSYGSSAPCAEPTGSGTSPVDVSAKVTGLAMGAEYHFRIAIHYHGGSATGEDLAFATLGHAPTVLTGAASAVGETSASLAGSVDPNGGLVGECGVEYGETTAYGHFAPCNSSPGGGQAPVAVSATATGLKANAVYHFRVLASNPAGPGRGGDQTFTTLPNAPIVATLPASAVAQTSATLNATVDPEGTPVTSCEFEFASAEAYTPCTPAPGSGQGPVAVSAFVSGLLPETTYLYRVVAFDASGTVYGAIESLTTQSSDPVPADVSLPPSEPAPAANHPVEPALPPMAPSIAPACQAELTRTSFSVAATGAFAIDVRCAPQDASGTGTVTVQTINAVRASRHPSGRLPLTLASGAFAVATDQTTALTLHLSARARSLLVRSHLLPAHATIVTRTTTGSTITRQVTITLRAHPVARSRRG